MERHSLYAALTDSTGSLLLSLAENALKPPSLAAINSLQSRCATELDKSHDHAAICRTAGKTPGTFAVAMSAETAHTLTSLVLGEIGEATPSHIANVVSEVSQWVASRALPRLGITDFDFAPETVVAESLVENFPPDSNSVGLLIETELGQLHVCARF